MEKLFVYLMIPYKINNEVNKTDFVLKSFTIIDPAMGMFKIMQYKDK